MSFLLGAHPQIATVGETGLAEGVDVEDYTCACRTPILECPFWAEVTRRLEAQGIPFDIGDTQLRFRLRDGGLADRLLRAGPGGPLFELARRVGLTVVPGARGELHRLLRRNEALARVVMELQQGDAYVDIAKRPNRLLHLRRIPSYRITVVHLIRDARAVSYSCIKNLGLTAQGGAESWLDYVAQARRTMRYFPEERRIIVRYEELCRDTRATLRRVFGAIGVRDDVEITDFRAVEQHIIGNRMRLGSSSEIRLDEKWRDALAADQLDTINRLTSEVNRSLGYGVD
jgi:ribosomal protein S9